MTKHKKLAPSIDFGYPTPADGPVPVFNSIEEEAEFWDTHDLTDFIKDDDVEIDLVLGPDFSSILRVPLEAADIDELGRRADEMGVEATALARMWIEERLRREAS